MILHLGNFTSSLPSKVAENSFTVARGYNSKTKACNLTYLQKKKIRKKKKKREKNIQKKQSNSIRWTHLVVLGHLWSWEGQATSAFKGDSLSAGKRGLGEEKGDWKGAVGLKSLSFHVSRWAGLKGKEQEVSPRGLDSSKDEEFSQEDQMLTEAEVAEYFVQIQWELCPSDNPAVSSQKQVT